MPPERKSYPNQCSDCNTEDKPDNSKRDNPLRALVPLPSTACLRKICTRRCHRCRRESPLSCFIHLGLSRRGVIGRVRANARNANKPRQRARGPPSSLLVSSWQSPSGAESRFPPCRGQAQKGGLRPGFLCSRSVVAGQPKYSMTSRLNFSGFSTIESLQRVGASSDYIGQSIPSPPRLRASLQSRP